VRALGPGDPRLDAARRRIRELEAELEITKKASALFAADGVRPKGSTR
jgi:hypothetical protein